jgi:hypothetical protein
MKKLFLSACMLACLMFSGGVFASQETVNLDTKAIGLTYVAAPMATATAMPSGAQVLLSERLTGAVPSGLADAKSTYAATLRDVGNLDTADPGRCPLTFT